MSRYFDILRQRSRTIGESRLIEVVERPSPLIVSLPHSGTLIPDNLREHFEHSHLVLLDTDILSDQAYASVAEQGSVVKTMMSPYVVNVNRGSTKPSLPVVPNQLLSGQATLLKPLSVGQRGRIVARYYQPYHAALARLIKHAQKRFGFALVLDGHSMDKRGMVHTKDPGAERADMIVSDNNGMSAHSDLIKAVMIHLIDAGYTVSKNIPYSGGHITRYYGNPQSRVHVVQIELSKSLYIKPIATERDLKRRPLVQTTPGLGRVQKALHRALNAALRAAVVV